MNEIPIFEHYVLNASFNTGKVFMFNIFDNVHVYASTLEAVKKYCRAPSKFEYKSFRSDEIKYGFEAFCEELRSIIQWQEWSRIEYEISVGDYPVKDVESLERWDCYNQAVPNIKEIAREVIYQYKMWKKEKEKKE